MYHTEDENLLRLAKKLKENPQSFICILGAGMSIPAGLPSWNGLLEGMIDYYEAFCKDKKEDCRDWVEQLRAMSNKWHAFGELKRLLPAAEYQKYIMTRLSCKGKAIPKAYELIWKLDINGVITFNVDRLVLDAFSQVRRSAVDYATSRERVKYSTFLSGENKFVFFPHGELSDPSSWVFTDREKREVYRDGNFKNIMTALLNSKNLIILGFNPREHNFLTLLNEIAVGDAIAGYDNYYIGDNLTASDCRQLGGYGISCINYTPEDKSHPEVVRMLEGFYEYIPRDEEHPSVYVGKKYTETDIPAYEDCLRVGTDRLREILNGNIANIIPPDTFPDQEQIQRLQGFYEKYAAQMHIAWFINYKSEVGNKIYGYDIKGSVGRGAFGNVYEVYDKDGNKYALKILLPEVKDKVQYLSCFRRGIRSMKILKDKHVEGMVKIYSSYEVPACIVMDYVEGVTLRRAVDDHLLKSLNKKLEVILSIAYIIHKAHGLEECILHRDLKPENVMLQDFYYENSEDAIPVVILDFDLSWHKGAKELTVALGAMSQGFMAPEQVEENERYKRNTAVDVYSIGMLSYYVLTCINPAPYQHRFTLYEEELIKYIKKNYRTHWKCLPTFLAEVIKKATLHDPAERSSLEGFIFNMKAALNMVISNEISNTHALLLRELAYQIDDSGEVKVDDFGRKLILTQLALGKEVKLELKQQRADIVVWVQIKKVRQGHDERNPKYLESSKSKALAKVNTGIFQEKRGEIELSAVRISMTARLPSMISLKMVCDMAKNIQDVRAQLELK